VEEDQKSGVEVLLQSSSKSGLYPLDTKKGWEPSEDQYTGPYATAISSSFGKKADEKSDDAESDDTQSETKQSNIVVFGSVEAFGKQILETTHLNNSEYFLNIFNKLSSNDANEEILKVNIEPKSLEGKELGIKQDELKSLSRFFYWILPLLILAVGLVIFAKRRNK
jgi:ABC-type uncharacterized transport system involved in gliding motility auxiliary subunit